MLFLEKRCNLVLHAVAKWCDPYTLEYKMANFDYYFMFFFYAFYSIFQLWFHHINYIYIKNKNSKNNCQIRKTCIFWILIISAKNWSILKSARWNNWAWNRLKIYLSLNLFFNLIWTDFYKRFWQNFLFLYHFS